MARASQIIAAMAVVFAGCVVSDPPENGIAKQTPPFVDSNKVSPNVFVRKDASSGETVSITVPVRSEDANDTLIGLLMLNYNVYESGLPIQQLLQVRFLPPGTFDETERQFEFPWIVNLTQGCYQVSFVITHESNLNGNQPIRTDDTAVVTWWVNVDDDGTNALQDCPERLGGSN